ncbi:hypothetical protein EHQ76_14665 [Leptospira barantonii]|uniref:Uncharacterized protein n=2 Tax=Leptospira barantonii TaxID=2023184 RepID=A0A5F2B092_9LEPT|nr:hypothetical protein EHQ76_14665 [Leptospira barantonii]
MFLNVFLFLFYFGTFFLIGLMPTTILWISMRFLFQESKYYPWIGFAVLVGVHSLVLEGMTALAASFD